MTGREREGEDVEMRGGEEIKRQSEGIRAGEAAADLFFGRKWQIYEPVVQFSTPPKGGVEGCGSSKMSASRSKTRSSFLIRFSASASL